MSSNYPPGTWAGDPRAPWNQEDGEDAQTIIDAMTGQDFYESSNHDVEGSLDAFDGRVDFRVPREPREWCQLTAAERDLFERYAEVVRGFAELYEDGVAY